MDAYKLDETIKDFESEVEKLKSVNAMYLKIENIYEQIIFNVDLYKNNNEELLNIKNELESVIKNYEKFQEKIEDLSKSIKESLEKDIAALRSENTQFNMGIIEEIGKLDGVYDKKISDIRKENREQYNELENLLASKLERIKSDIEVSIRDGNINTERAVGNQLDLKFIQFNELTEKKFEQISKKISNLFMLSGGILVGVIAGLILSYMGK